MISREVYVEYTDGAHRCYTTPDGKEHRLYGCRHLSPRDAIEHAARLKERHANDPEPEQEAEA